MSATKNQPASGNNKPAGTAAMTDLSAGVSALALDNMNSIESADRRLLPNNANTNFKLSANFFPVVLGSVTTLYEYRVESIVKVKPARPTTTSSRRPLHPKRAPLPKGVKKSTPREKQQKASQDQVYLKKFQQSAPSGDPGNNDTGEEPKLPKRVRRRLMFLLCDRMHADGVAVAIASDYDTCLLTVEPIEHKSVPGIWRVAYYDEDEEADDPNLHQYDVIVGPPSATDVEALLAAKGKTLTGKPGDNSLSSNIAALESLPALLNPFFSHCPNSYTRREVRQEATVASIGTNRFYLLDWPNQGGRNSPPWSLKTQQTPDNVGGVAAIPGFFRSIRVSIGSGILLNINTTTSAFYKAGNLQDILQEFGWHQSPYAINSFIKGVRVRTTYMRRSVSAKKKAVELRGHDAVPREHIYTIRGLPFLDYMPTASNVYFEHFPEGSATPVEITVAEYWRRADKHRIILQSTDQVIDCGKAGFIPAKFLEVLPGQNYKPKTEMIAHACRPPTINYDLIMGDGMWLFGINPLDQYSPASCFSGLTVKQNMVQVPVVKLSSGQLRYANMTKSEQDLSRGRWNLMHVKAFSPVSGKQYIVYELVRPGKKAIEATYIDNFSRNFAFALTKFGLSLTAFKGEPEKHGRQLRSHKGKNFDEQDLIQAFTTMKKDGVSLAVILLPDNDAELYAQIKRAGDVGTGLHTICVVSGSNKARGDKNNRYWGPKSDLATLANLAMKVNLKLSRRGANQVPPKPLTDKLLAGKTMIVGIDVTHPASNSVKGSHSVAAVVSSVDENFAQYPASLRANPRPAADSGQSMEQVVNLAEMMQERLIDFKTVRGGLPDQLLIYRDGLSESQFDMCTQFELPQIKTAITKVYGASKLPKILLVCSVKRHHTRFFPAASSGPQNQILDAKLNPLPGVAVFDQITYGDNKDFFLVSHETLQGTTRPCHYVVLHNEFDNLGITDVARTTHKLCYLFGRATRSVSVAPPAYYADLAADRARFYVREWYLPKEERAFDAQAFANALRVHDDVKQSMFYI